MLILHVPCPLPPHERLWLKSTWQLLCSPPPFGSLSPALPCCAAAPCSMPFYSALLLLLLEEGEGERLGFPMGLQPPAPLHGQSPHRPPESHLASLAVPLHTVPCPMLSNPRPLGSWQRSLQWAGEPRASPCCQGANVAVPLHGYPPAAEPEQGCLPPSLPPHHQHPSVSVLSPCIRREGGRPDSLGISSHPGMGHSSCPVLWEAQPAGTRHRSAATRKISK